MRLPWSTFGLVLTTSLIWGCAPGTGVYNVPAGSANQAVTMTASSFEFSPAIIHAHRGDRLLFKVTNRAGLDHNLTIEDPQGKTIQSVPLPAGKTVEVELNLTEAGLYHYFCNRPLHSTLGMTGTIESRP